MRHADGLRSARSLRPRGAEGPAELATLIEAVEALDLWQKTSPAFTGGLALDEMFWDSVSPLVRRAIPARPLPVRSAARRRALPRGRRDRRRTGAARNRAAGRHRRCLLADEPGDDPALTTRMRLARMLARSDVLFHPLSDGTLLSFGLDSGTFQRVSDLVMEGGRPSASSTCSGRHALVPFHRRHGPRRGAGLPRRRPPRRGGRQASAGQRPFRSPTPSRSRAGAQPAGPRPVGEPVRGAEELEGLRRQVSGGTGAWRRPFRKAGNHLSGRCPPRRSCGRPRFWALPQAPPWSLRAPAFERRLTIPACPSQQAPRLAGPFASGAFRDCPRAFLYRPTGRQPERKFLPTFSQSVGTDLS